MSTIVSVLADTYTMGSHCEPTPAEKKEFTDWILTQYFNLPVRVKFVDSDVSPEAMLHHHKWNHILYISTLHSEHPMLTQMQNWMFRAIHDYHHVSQGFGFDAAGEIASARYAMSTAPKSIHWMIWSEIALQAAATVHTGKFQAQKLVNAYFV
jgi:hypothetical protein